jgi:Ca2+-transporting ATPase
MRVVGFFSNPWLLGAWSATIGLQVAVVYVPFLQRAFDTVSLGVDDWLWILAVSIPVFLIGEAVKVIQWRRRA